MVKRAGPDDLADAALIAALITATAVWEAETGRRAPQKVLREALWFYWQSPRSGPGLPGRAKYPLSWPWTAAARAAIAADPAAPLIVEHVIPVSLIIRSLLDRSPWTPETLAYELRRLFVMAVITPEEHQRLGAGSIDDPWSRYTVAGITDLAPFDRTLPAVTTAATTVGKTMATVATDPGTTNIRPAAPGGASADVLRTARERAGLSRPQLSRLCGVTIASLHSLEHGRPPRPGEVEAVLAALGERQAI